MDLSKIFGITSLLVALVACGGDDAPAETDAATDTDAAADTDAAG